MSEENERNRDGSPDGTDRTDLAVEQLNDESAQEDSGTADEDRHDLQQSIDDDAAESPPETDDDDGPLDLDARVLCSDGACVGVIGHDGRCKLCRTPHPDGPPGAARRPADGTQPEATAPVAELVESQPDEVDADLPAGQPAEAAPPSGLGTDDPLDFSRRVMCSDGTCVGVIGLDGKCRACGKPYAGEPEV